MSRNVQFQVLRGTQAQLGTLQAGFDPDTGNAVNPLQMGEMYFTTDTNCLYFGTPGFGTGYIQIGDVSDLQTQIEELRAKVSSQKLALENIGVNADEFAEA